MMMGQRGEGLRYGITGITFLRVDYLGGKRLR
jgi:hypothetical protein